ncbi:MAG TPA: nucleotide pyrophosphohydrolase [Tepidisphaeraceae bacterium]|jgi:NTP pyrophosphatase (non-canonical NTP hydrolase)
MTLEEMRQVAVKFRDERDWKQFHSPKELAIQVVLEATELLELMQWKNGAELAAVLEDRKQDVADELADVLHGVVLIADEMGIDLGQAFVEKMKKNERKYPIEKARGSSRKYTEYEK